MTLPGAAVERDGGASLELWWIPLGAGVPVVRASGRIYEAVVARLARRLRRDLYHSALIATAGSGQTVIEMAPIPDGEGSERRGVVAEGPVGMGWLRRFRVFRYEVRRWSGGVIPDLGDAVASPVRLTEDPAEVARVLELVAQVPTPVWGRDELHAGEMWNSNSVVSWTLARAGLLGSAGQPPPNGRAPGWDAGIVVAGLSQELPSPVPLTDAPSPRGSRWHQRHADPTARAGWPGGRESAVERGGER